MSRLYYDSQYKICSTQIYQWLLFVIIISSENLVNGFESQDAIFVNFHRRHNVSKVAILHDNSYLPPASIPDFSLPEVIDNRARNVAVAITDETRNYPNALYHLPERDSLRVSTRKGPYDTRYPGNDGLRIPLHHRRPTFQQGKHPQQTTTQPSPSPLPIGETSPSVVNRVSVEEMSCQNTRDELFFRVSIKAKNSVSPVIDNVMSDTCQAIAVRDSYRINFENDQVWNCGVVNCSTDGNQSYCLDLRFPVIPGLRLKDDHRVTLRCKTQNRIAYHTKRISVKTLEAKARNVPGVLDGGAENALNVDVGLFRKTYGSKNIFDTKIQSGGTVVLGEEILLRVLINGNDSWRHSKIGQVTMHYVEERQQQKIVNSLWILDKDGCLNPDVHEICPREQYAMSPLESYLIFQAFMFESMKETDEIFLTVKAMACVESVDCILDCPGGHIRRARSVSDRNNTVEWQNDIVLRVVLPKYETHALQNYYLAILLSAIALLALIMLLWTIRTSLRQRISKS
ncbi:PREDICTED: uncharacterized protein LOC108779019 [Cyphomyrmex costatus]|uniref:ZP domain-containing protein n=1 Tax=Cyphomyrmex costatus TaxID=456900 RepID=A0A195C7C7_9HYME|nr:PREDICTED: uncharacterized protein LOC108779019 [Cyphomyrmex costatus]KYM96747.1 hypothetical protein ALC62_12539 [Cyphomyrmex costatus]